MAEALTPSPLGFVLGALLFFGWLSLVIALWRDSDRELQRFDRSVEKLGESPIPDNVRELRPTEETRR